MAQVLDWSCDSSTFILVVSVRMWSVRLPSSPGMKSREIIIHNLIPPTCYVGLILYNTAVATTSYNTVPLLQVKVPLRVL